MTPQEIQRMMDFILRSNANFFVRMEKSAEELHTWRAEVQETHRKTAAEIRDLLKSQREHAKSQQRYEKRLRALEASDRRTRRRVEGIKDLLKLFSKRADVHSKRIDRLERNGR
jgi:hypothetical protein